MKRIYLVLMAAALAGCQFTLGQPGEIAGVVTDITGDAVRGADVSVDGTQLTRTSSNGTFTVRGVQPGTHTIRVTLTIGSTPYRGTNRTIVYSGERTTSVSVVVARVSDLGNMRGFAQDLGGRPLDGIRVFAAGPLGSWMTLTDSNGNYQIDDLVGGNNYTVTASGRGYRNDTTNFNAIAGQTGTVNFQLANSTNENENTVSNLTSSAWTSPEDPDRRPNHVSGYERIKQIVDPKRPKNIATKLGNMNTNGPGTGRQVEIDLQWDYKFYSELLGYGIYKGTSPTGNLQAYDVLRDPLAAFYADISDNNIPGIRYFYQVTRLNTDFPTGGGESTLSADTSSVALPRLDLFDVTFFPLTFHWQVAANTYIVYLFSYYPDFQAVPIWTSSSTSSTNLTYTGPALTSGATYYYVVVGTDNSGTARTISQIDHFIAP